MTLVDGPPHPSDERVSELLVLARTARSRSSVLAQTVTVRLAETEAARHETLELHLRCRWHRSYFRLKGLVGDAPVAATLTREGLLAHDELLRRARLVVALGERFECEDGTTLPASLEGPPIAVALTLLRACDRALEFGLALDHYPQDR